MTRIVVVLLFCCVALAGCGLRGDSSRGPSLAKEIAGLPGLDEQSLEPVVEADLGAVVGAYRTLYPSLADSEQNHAAGKRLADLELERAGLAAPRCGEPL